MFTGVCLSTGGGAWSRGLPGPGGGVPGLGDTWLGGVWSGGCLLQGGCLMETPQTATAAGGTHPTAMHSCHEDKMS